MEGDLLREIMTEDTVCETWEDHLAGFLLLYELLIVGTHTRTRLSS